MRHALLGLGRPSDGLLGAHLEPRNLEARREEDIAGRGAENVLRVAPQRRLVFRTMDADPMLTDVQTITDVLGRYRTG
jgi:hypothetical protein